MGPAAGIGLYRMDGTLITRLPFRERDIGLNIGHDADMFQRAATQSVGHYEVTAVTDGVRRLYSYRRVGDLPLIVAVGTSLDTIYAGWQHEAWMVGTIGLLLATAVVALSILASRELERRAKAEKKLALLASTDALTSLLNRRAFDETLQRRGSAQLDAERGSVCL